MQTPFYRRNWWARALSWCVSPVTGAEFPTESRKKTMQRLSLQLSIADASCCSGRNAFGSRFPRPMLRSRQRELPSTLARRGNPTNGVSFLLTAENSQKLCSFFSVGAARMRVPILTASQHAVCRSRSRWAASSITTSSLFIASSWNQVAAKLIQANYRRTRDAVPFSVAVTATLAAVKASLNAQ